MNIRQNNISGKHSPQKQDGLIARIWKARHRYVLMIPFMAALIIFCYFPMYGIVLAFKDYRIQKGILGSPWAGMKYFNLLFTSPSFFQVLRNTLIISLQKLMFSFPAPILLALFINEIRASKVKKVFQTVSYMPHFLSWIVAATILREILSLTGPVNALLSLFGWEPIYFLADSKTFRGMLVVTDIWKGCGWGSIVYLAAIAGVNQELYEAARIDGARKWQEIWHITLPCIRGTILILFILAVGGLLSAGFDQVYNLKTSAVNDVGDILDTYVYAKGLYQGDYSFATAAGLFKNVIGLVLVMISNYVTGRLSGGEEGLW